MIENGTSHKWRFFRAAGFDQVRLDSGADLMALEQLDQKLWVSLSCPTSGLEFDAKTLNLIDTDQDGRIRVQEILAAVKWACSILKNPDDLTLGSKLLPLSAINEETPEGRYALAISRQILDTLGKAEADAISVEDTADTTRIFSQMKFNGDGIISVDSSDDPSLKAVIQEIIDCLGSEIDRSGNAGISQDKLDRFFNEARSYSDWWKEAEASPSRFFPLGEATSSAYTAFMEVRKKVDDYFVRCRMAAFDPRSVPFLNRQETEYAEVAAGELSSSAENIAGFPVARIEAGRALPLVEGINPAWTNKMSTFKKEVALPLIGKKEELTEADWETVLKAFADHEKWLSGKAGATVERLGIARVREILNGNAGEEIARLIEKDISLVKEANAISDVERLVCYYTNIYTLLNNFVSFRDFYTGRAKAVFQAGTLYLDGRSCDLCVRADDIAKHSALAGLSKICLVYCSCVRRRTGEKMTIAAAFTDGDADFLMAGRNGIFYDRLDRDWDATIVKIIEHPISIRQAFWAPYRRISRMIGEQMEKFAASKDKAVHEKAASGIEGTVKAIDSGKAPEKPAPFDIAKFAGIFAAIGLAFGAIGSAIAVTVTGLLKLAWWQIPFVVAGGMAAISGPSMLLAWLKLRQRSLGPVLDACGWAVNSRTKINIPFGASLTAVAALPEGAERSLEDPYAEKPSRWPKILIAMIAIGLAVLVLNKTGLLYQITGIGSR